MRIDWSKTTLQGFTYRTLIVLLQFSFFSGLNRIQGSRLIRVQSSHVFPGAQISCDQIAYV